MISDSLLDQWRELLLEHPYPHINQWLDHIGAENKQGNINKEECVNIVRKISLKPIDTTHKVLTMWLPEYLGKEGNRLLKLIEEPPENTIFILVAENQELKAQLAFMEREYAILQARNELIEREFEKAKSTIDHVFNNPVVSPFIKAGEFAGKLFSKQQATGRPPHTSPQA